MKTTTNSTSSTSSTNKNTKLSKRKARENAKRRQRLQALNNEETHAAQQERVKRRIAASLQKCCENYLRMETILQVAQNENHDDDKPQDIYCKKTGAVIGTLDTQTAAITEWLYEKLPDDGRRARTRDTWTQNHIHPAWLETSHDNLRELQQVMPHEYCIYLVSLLYPDTPTTPAQKNQQLQLLYHNVELVKIFELAETLRRCMAIFGRYPDRLKNRPQFIFHDIETTIIALQEWLTSAVKTVQKTLHTNDIERQRVITIADIKNFKTTTGSKLFQSAKSETSIDEALLVDLTELFTTTGVDLKTAIVWTKPRDLVRKNAVVKTPETSPVPEVAPGAAIKLF